MVLQEHQDQMNEALVAYDDALDQGDPSRLDDGLLLALPPVVNDSDILLSPSSDANKLNGVNGLFNLIYLFTINKRTLFQ